MNSRPSSCKIQKLEAFLQPCHSTQRIILTGLAALDRRTRSELGVPCSDTPILQQSFCIGANTFVYILKRQAFTITNHDFVTLTINSGVISLQGTHLVRNAAEHKQGVHVDRHDTLMAHGATTLSVYSTQPRPHHVNMTTPRAYYSPSRNRKQRYREHREGTVTRGDRLKEAANDAIGPIARKRS